MKLFYLLFFVPNLVFANNLELIRCTADNKKEFHIERLKLGKVPALSHTQIRILGLSEIPITLENTGTTTKSRLPVQFMSIEHEYTVSKIVDLTWIDLDVERGSHEIELA